MDALQEGAVGFDSRDEDRVGEVVPVGERQRLDGSVFLGRLPLLGRLEIADQLPRLVGAHPVVELHEILDGVDPMPSLGCGNQADHSALRRLLPRIPLHEAARITPGLQWSGQPQEQNGHAGLPRRSVTIPSTELTRPSMSTPCPRTASGSVCAPTRST